MAACTPLPASFTPASFSPISQPATVAGCEMGLKLAGVRLAGSGVAALMDHFAEHGA